MAQTSMTGGRPVNRPLSPHLQIWRWHVTMATSIAHRASGVGNAVGALLLTWWLVAAATGPEAYAVFAGFISSLIGQLMLFGFTASLIYHMLNGIRHLFWDTGAGFDLATSRNSGLFVFAAAGILTVILWIAAYMGMGGA
ncbi:MAG: succinate dehydrogenase, cytochrome b556 subunit [Alphaproteobacteria bacterium]